MLWTLIVVIKNKLLWNRQIQWFLIETLVKAVPKISKARSQMKPKYLTQDDIKQYCISTVNASLDTIKKISSDTIFKVYIKSPIQNYTEKIYQNLDNIG